MVAIKHLTWCLMGGLNTIRRSPIESHGCMKRKENLCRVIARRARYSLGCRTGLDTPTMKVQKVLEGMQSLRWYPKNLLPAKDTWFVYEMSFGV